MAGKEAGHQAYCGCSGCRKKALAELRRTIRKERAALKKTMKWKMDHAKPWGKRRDPLVPASEESRVASSPACHGNDCEDDIVMKPNAYHQAGGKDEGKIIMKPNRGIGGEDGEVIVKPTGRARGKHSRGKRASTRRRSAKRKAPHASSPRSLATASSGERLPSAPRRHFSSRRQDLSLLSGRSRRAALPKSRTAAARAGEDNADESDGADDGEDDIPDSDETTWEKIKRKVREAWKRWRGALVAKSFAAKTFLILALGAILGLQLLVMGKLIGMIRKGYSRLPSSSSTKGEEEPFGEADEKALLDVKAFLPRRAPSSSGPELLIEMEGAPQKH